MSQSHIPQPNAAPMAPAEQIDSTAEAPHGPAMTIEVPGPPPSEAISHVGEANSIDPLLYKQNLWCASFPWKVGDQVGKCLWWIPIHPSSYNKIMSHLARIYNCWAGDATISIKVAGTGFHAGLLTMVRLPPNIHPNSMSGTKDWTAFPWEAYDPKMLEVASIQARDQRPVSYHYNEGYGNPLLDIGGYIAIYVDLGLNTSSSGSQQIQVNVWSKLADNFCFSQLRYPYEPLIKGDRIAPVELLALVDFRKDRASNIALACAPILIKSIVVKSFNQKVLNTGIYNCFPLTSSYMSKVHDNFHSSLDKWTGKVSKVDGKKITLEEIKPFWQFNTVGKLGLTAYNTTKFSFSLIEGLTQLGVRSASFTYVEPELPWGIDDVIQLFPSFVGDQVPIESTFEDNSYSAKTDNESFLLFRGGDVDCPQTIDLARYLRGAWIASWLPKGQCGLFSVNDTSEDLPIGYAKLYDEGFFTFQASKDELVFPFENIQLKFEQFISRTDAIPNNSEFARNKILLTMKYRASAKLSRPPKRDHGSSSSISSSRSSK